MLFFQLFLYYNIHKCTHTVHYESVFATSSCFACRLTTFSICSPVTLFELTVVNNWYITMVTSYNYILAAAALQICIHWLLLPWLPCRKESPPWRATGADCTSWPSTSLPWWPCSACLFPVQKWSLNFYLRVCVDDFARMLLQVVMTIIVAFILDAFVFRMNYSRKNREQLESSEGGTTLFFLTYVSDMCASQMRFSPVVLFCGII